MIPDYSVVIPAFNAAETLHEALHSVEKQTISPAYIIVVDDGSTDETPRLAATFASVRVIRKSNGGPGSATTAGIDVVETPYFATLDSDDVWLPQKMERQLAVMEKDPTLAGCFSHASMFRHEDGIENILPAEPVRLWTRTTMVFRTADAAKIGPMRDFPGYLGDLVDWLGRSREIGQKHLMLDDILALRRIRKGSLSDTKDANRTRGYLHAAFEALKRRQMTQPSGD
jgi:glycosyltransferase involved in cell wall biosynthesis